MLVNVKDLEELPKQFESDIAVRYLKRLHTRQLSLKGRSNEVVIYNRPAYEYLEAIINNWEDLLCVM
jgi:hypothetical protein